MQVDGRPAPCDADGHRALGAVLDSGGLDRAEGVRDRLGVGHLPAVLLAVLEDALSHRETPHLAYTLATTDGGKTWKSTSASLFGQVTRIRVNRSGVGLGLIEYSDSFRYPSEAYKLDWKTGRNETIYRDKKYAITDVWLSPDGTAYLAGVDVAGEVRSVLPGSVKVYRSKDFKSWTEMAVDYRAVAQRATLAAFGEDLWLATDSGMILKLQ